MEIPFRVVCYGLMAALIAGTPLLLLGALTPANVRRAHLPLAGILACPLVAIASQVAWALHLSILQGLTAVAAITLAFAGRAALRRIGPPRSEPASEAERP